MLHAAPMSLVVFQDVSLSLGGKTIVEGLDLSFANGERVGLVGPNGSGKTTLFRLIAGEQSPDGGEVRRSGTCRIGYLPQDVSVAGDQELLSYVRDSVPGRAALDQEIASVEAELSAASESVTTAADQDRIMELAERLADLHERAANVEAQFSEHEAKRILSGLRFRDTDMTRSLGEFSGGWKMRAVLASLLFQRPDLLLLDEPTNHLDMPSVGWLSGFLKRYDQAFVLVSHDREFLNEQIDRVVSFEVEGVRSYKGDYERYRTQRAEELTLIEARARNLQKEREHMEKFIERFRAKATKAAQVQSRIRQLEKMETIDLPSERASINFRFPPAQRAGKDVVRVEGLSKSYGSLEVLSDLELRATRGERIAIIGVNGAGKTTLLRILASEIASDSGTIEFGTNTKVGYYAQHHADTLNRARTVYDEVAANAKDAGHKQIRAALGAMLFGDREVEKLVGVLSGGERARVALSKLLVDPGNVLLLDEPTNHLDLESSERLAEALLGFEGTMLFVSHNRAFIRALATKIWSVEQGKVVEYPGTFDEYLYSCGLRESSGEDPSTEPDGAQGSPRKGERARKRKDRGGTNGRKQEEARQREKSRRLKPLRARVKELEARIQELETAQNERTAALSDPAVYEHAEQRESLTTAFTKAQAELEVATEAWLEAQGALEAAEEEA